MWIVYQMGINADVFVKFVICRYQHGKVMSINILLPTSLTSMEKAVIVSWNLQFIGWQSKLSRRKKR